MRELKLVADESTRTSLVLSAAEGEEGADGEQFFLELTDEALSLLAPLVAGRPEAKAPEAESENQDEREERPEPAPAPEPARPNPTTGLSSARQPRAAAPLSLRPREIQERVRGGATVEELAEEMGVSTQRLEGFAHPVLLERARVAELGKKAHPVREEGPARHTLWEVLAQAFAARGLDLSESSWDAFREPGGSWVLAVTWRSGVSRTTGEWWLRDHLSSDATAEPRNSVAADIVDPDFQQPVRSLTPIGRGHRGEQDLEDTRDDLEPVPDDDAEDAGDSDESPREAEGEDSGFLQHPDERNQPRRRRRKATTPHWEDVLLGVRANTKRPKK
ncbi:septation protein SepH [Corynebacterium otitidis]